MIIPFSSIHLQVPVMISEGFSHHQNKTKEALKDKTLSQTLLTCLCSFHTLLSAKYFNRWTGNSVESDLNPNFLGISGDKQQVGLHYPAVTQRAGAVLETESLCRDAGRKHGHCKSQSTQPELRNLSIFCQFLAWNRKIK